MSLPPERDLIKLLTEPATIQNNTAGFANDCAILPRGDEDLILTVDTFAQDTHFPPTTPPRSAGTLAIQATLSDLAAAGASVLGVLAGYGLPEHFTEGQARELAQAITHGIQAHGGELLGGDTKPRESLTLALTAIGTCPPGTALRRDQAQPGDELWVTGPLGGAGAALDRIQAGLAPRQAAPLLEPTARIQAGHALRDANARCAMDLSDGLADGAVALAQASDVHVVLEADQVPLHPWAQDEDEGLGWALSTGGDYELLASLSPQTAERVVHAWDVLGLAPARVGRVEDGTGATLIQGQAETVLTRGFEHQF